MKRTVIIQARTDDDSLREGLAEPLASALDRWKPGLTGDIRVKWVFHEPEWGALAQCRDVVGGSGFRRVVESWVAGFDDAELLDGAALVHLLPAGLPEAAEPAEPPFEQRACEGCGRRLRTAMVAGRAMELRCSRAALSGLVRTSASRVILASASLLQALADAGLDGGLHTLPAAVRDAEEGSFFALHAPVELGWPPAPYGMVEGPCGRCGANVPRYNFYRCFERLPEPRDWMAWPLYGPTGLLVTGRVYRWLVTEGRELIARTDGQRLRGWRHGWFPDEAERAFLPVAYQAATTG